MRIDIMTLFPEYFESPFSTSIIKRGVEKSLVSFNYHQIRDFGKGNYKQVDDSPYGGGAGLVMKPDILMACYESIEKKGKTKSVYLSPRGRTFNQQMASTFAQDYDQLIFLAGHYEGVDQRFLELSEMEEISLGDFVLTGGEPAVAVIVDAIVRLLPGVVGNEESIENESFSRPLLEHDHYTMPRVFRDCKVPRVLLSGDHKKIDSWRLRNSLMRTLERRPELLSKLPKDFFEKM